MDFEVKRMLYKLTRCPDDPQFLLEDMASRIMCTLAWDREYLFLVTPYY